MEQHQVIVTGAGPSGAACAQALRQAGIDVVVLEKEKLPRNKICSGVLFGQTQVLLKKYFGRLPPEEVYCAPREMPAERLLEWHPDKGFFPYVWETGKDGQEFPKVYLNIWRSRFDSWLAGQCGAEVRQKVLVRSAAEQAGGIRVKVAGRSGMADSELACDYLVGADGWNSTVRGFVDEQWRTKPADVIVYQEYCRFDSIGSLRPGHWHVFFVPEVGDILCCAHKKDEYLTLCMGAGRGKHIRQGMTVFKKFLAENFQVKLASVSRAEGCTIRQLPPNLGAGRVLLVGEGAGFAYLNGEGLSAAIDSGYRAGQAIAQAIQHGGDALEIYRGITTDIMRHMELCFKNMHFLMGQ